MPKRNSESQKKVRWMDESVDRCKLTPMNDRQKMYMSAIRNHRTTISLGSAGTGKTFIAASIAAEMLLAKRIDKIIITRPLVAVGNTVGLLPGTLDEKLEPWFKPITSVLVKRLGQGAYDSNRKNGNIEFAAFEQMQGSSFENAFIILDEAQNCDAFELKMFLTRLGQNCKAVIDGDVKQCSLKEQSGLKKVIEMVDTYALPVPIVQFEITDVVRSDECLMWLAAFEAMENGDKDIHPFARERVGTQRFSY